VGPAVVLGHDLDVLVAIESIELVLDAEIRKVDRLVEIRQLVFVRPSLDVALIPIRSPVAVRPTAIVFLQPLLVLSLELVLEDDSANVSALFAEPLFRAQIGAIELGVVS
jgi:hypothetical protein